MTYTLSDDQRDCLQETVNVAMGSAGDALARFLEVFVQLSVPRINLVSPQVLNEGLAACIGDVVQVSAVRQGFHSSVPEQGIRGETLVIFSDSSFKELAELLAYDEGLDESMERELLLDIANVIAGSCVNGVGVQLEEDLRFSAPSVLGQHLSPGQILEDTTAWSTALIVEINYTLEERLFQCSLTIMLTDAAIQNLKLALDRMLED